MGMGVVLFLQMEVLFGLVQVFGVVEVVVEEY